MLWIFGLLLAFGLSGGMAVAGVETVEIEKIQIVGTLSGLVKDVNGDPIPGAKVDEVSSDWETVIQGIATDSHGWFSLTPQNRKKIHYIVVRAPGFNLLRVRVKLRAGSAAQLDLQLEVST